MKHEIYDAETTRHKKLDETWNDNGVNRNNDEM